MEFIENNLSYLFDKFVPVRTLKPRPETKPWFTNEIKELISKRDFAYKRWKRFKTIELREEYKFLRRKVVAAITKAKTKEINDKFDAAINSKQKWSQIKKLGIVPSSNKEIDSSFTKLDEINNMFVNVNVPTFASNTPEPPTERCSQSENSFYFHSVGENDVIDCIKSITSKAVGIDNIYPEFIKILLPVILPYITHVFNNILLRSDFPQSWKRAKVIPLPKDNGEFRPISILSYLSKILEKLMYRQMIKFLNDHCLLNKCQSGFRENRSCVTALIDVTENIRECVDSNGVSILVLLDHTKAFNTVEPGILCPKLSNRYMFSRSAANLISSYLTGRSQCVCVGDSYSNLLPVNRGVPQGSVLGPLLFNLYINDLPEVLRSAKLHIYADDIQLYSHCERGTVAQCIAGINAELERIHNWAKDNCLCINPKKSKCLVISKRSLSLDGITPPCINGDPINFSSSAKNLGVIFNRSLNWNNHVSSVVGRVYGMLRTLWRTQTYTPVKIRILLSKTYVISTLLHICL